MMNYLHSLKITSIIVIIMFIIGLLIFSKDEQQETKLIIQQDREVSDTQNEYPVERLDTTVYSLNPEEFREYLKLTKINCNDLKLSQKQLRTLSVVKIFAKPHNLINTMTAIALQESSLNNSAVNPKSGALGLGQILPATARSIAIQRNEFISDKDIATKLTNDVRMNLTYMLDVIKYFTKVNQQNGYIDHNRVWLGYYSGHAYDDSTSYDRAIVNNIKLLKNCKYI